MALITFATRAASPNALSFQFARNPSHPRAHPAVSAARILYRTADGTPYLEECGEMADLVLRWPDDLPMHADDWSDLRTFWRYTRGGQDAFDFTDDEGTTHVAYFMGDLDGFARVANGYTGSLALRIIT